MELVGGLLDRQRFEPLQTTVEKLGLVLGYELANSYNQSFPLVQIPRELPRGP